jgi:hypothetical protein
MVSALRLLNCHRRRHLQVCLDCGIRMTSVRFGPTAIGSYAGRWLGSGRACATIAGSDLRLARICPLMDRQPDLFCIGGRRRMTRKHWRRHFLKRACGDLVAAASCGRCVSPRAPRAMTRDRNPRCVRPQPDGIGVALSCVDRLALAGARLPPQRTVLLEWFVKKSTAAVSSRCAVLLLHLSAMGPKIRSPGPAAPLSRQSPAAALRVADATSLWLRQQRMRSALSATRPTCSETIFRAASSNSGSVPRTRSASTVTR